jgi:acetyltransferase-like isoleucine patch superfamily enzyme
MYNLISENTTIGNNTNIEYGAVVSDNVIIGDDCFIGYHTVIRPGVTIGNGSEIRALNFIAEGAKIGNGVKIIQLTNVCKEAVIEDNVFIGTGVLFFDTKKISHQRPYSPYGEPAYIEYGARIGSGVLLYPSVRVGKNSMIYAGSYVTKSTDPYGIYRGQPAVKIGEVNPEEIL